MRIWSGRLCRFAAKSARRGYRGRIDRQGWSGAAIHVPPLAALVGLRIHTAFVTLSPLAPQGIQSISPAMTITIAP
ncbi:MAG: hypothetical protein JXQ29_02665 [Planctomycetes bacterium]|nr:hypothetical protein [Planctomycetota bacterium]